MLCVGIFISIKPPRALGGGGGRGLDSIISRGSIPTSAILSFCDPMIP